MRVYLLLTLDIDSQTHLQRYNIFTSQLKLVLFFFVVYGSFYIWDTIEASLVRFVQFVSHIYLLFTVKRAFGPIQVMFISFWTQLFFRVYL